MTPAFAREVIETNIAERMKDAALAYANLILMHDRKNLKKASQVVGLAADCEDLHKEAERFLMAWEAGADAGPIETDLAEALRRPSKAQVEAHSEALMKALRG